MVQQMLICAGKFVIIIGVMSLIVYQFKLTNSMFNINTTYIPSAYTGTNNITHQHMTYYSPSYHDIQVYLYTCQNLLAFLCCIWTLFMAYIQHILLTGCIGVLVSYIGLSLTRPQLSIFDVNYYDYLRMCGRDYWNIVIDTLKWVHAMIISIQHILLQYMLHGYLRIRFACKSKYQHYMAIFYIVYHGVPGSIK
jgi:hypothetical protein